MNALMTIYSERVSDVKKIIHDLIRENVISDGNEIRNDHIVFRTMGVPHLSIALLEKIFILNHYTISVHYFKEGYNQFNEFLERNGIVLNNSGGKIKVSFDRLLLQSSTIAQIAKATFAGNEVLDIASSYVEFAERKREHLREGFEANNVNKFFESTFTSQINRSK